MRARAALAALLLAALPALAAPAAAQAPPARPPLPPAPGETTPLAPAPPDPDAPPPYEAEIERLAERLGTLALLRDLCGDRDGALFRDRMAALIDAEGRTGPRRDRLAGAFNRGFDGYAASYRSCTPSARLVVARALAEVDRLARDLRARYGGA